MTHLHTCQQNCEFPFIYYRVYFYWLFLEIQELHINSLLELSHILIQM